MDDITKQKAAKLEREKEKLRLRQNLLREKEKRIRIKRAEEVGKLAYKANIDQVDKDVLLGAFIEIAEKLDDKTQIKEWEAKAFELRAMQEKDEGTPMVISFKETPSNEVRELLKKWKFRWNKFRKEFEGYGVRGKIEEALSGAKYDLTVVE